MSINLTKSPVVPPHAVRLTKARAGHRLTKVSLAKRS